MSDELHADLEELRAAIDRVETTGDGRDELMAVLRAVEQKLEEPEDDDRHRHLNDRVNEAVANYEVSHPELTAVLRRIADTLSSSGI